MTRKIFALVFITVICLTSAGQTGKYFEGKITYTVSFKSDKIPDADKKLGAYFGNSSVLFFKEGNYRHEYIAGIIEFDLYLKKENKTYFKKRNNDTLYFIDCSLEGDSIQDFVYTPKSDTVAGIVCDRLIIKYKDRSPVHYYNSDAIKINPNWFKNFNLDQEYLIDKREKSIDLKSEHPFEDFVMIETATAISREIINDTKFTLPAYAVLAPLK